eukprot:m.11279 g.11279  ORF g.11279 m.11279 type:complete len:160 (-) comp5691_c0_seq1:427-906(-)
MAEADDVLDLVEDQPDVAESTPVTGLQSRATKRKGRGFKDPEGSKFDAAAVSTAADAPAQSVEGWIVLATGIHEEAQDEDIQDHFAEFGTVKNMHLNMDRQTGYAKGYALIEYQTFAEGEAAITQGSGSEILGQQIQVGWAFVRGNKATDRRRSRGRRD